MMTSTAKFCLLSVIAVVLMVRPASAQATAEPTTSSSCNDWHVMWGPVESQTHYLGGTGTPAGGASIAACQEECRKNEMCSGIDYNTADGAGNFCYLFLGTVGNKESNPTTTHYNVTSRTCSDTTSDCVNTWSAEEQNTNYGGGSYNTAGNGSVSDCQAQCVADMNCVAIDWNPNNPNRCWLLPNLNGQKFTGTNSGISHYNLMRCGTTVTGGSAMTTSGTQCVNTWSDGEQNTNYGGGSYNTAGNGSVPDCQAQCVADMNCVAIDWNPNNPNRCWLLPNLNGQKFTGTNSGITHYNLLVRCGAEVTTMPPMEYTCVVVLNRLGGALTYDQTSHKLEITYDVNEATWFSEKTCLASGISDFTVTDNCKSWATCNQTSWHLRVYDRSGVLHPEAGQAFPRRYQEDASFYRDPHDDVYFTMKPVIYNASNYYYYKSGSYVRVDNDMTLSYNGVDFWLYGVADPTSPVTDSCPNTWMLLKYTESEYKTYVGSYTDEECRARCLVYPRCVGVNVGYSSSCYVLTSDQDSSQKLVINTQYRMYDRMTYHAPCSLGCSTTYRYGSLTLNGYTENTYTNVTVKYCAAYCAGTCAGFTWSIDGMTSTCKVYYNAILNTNTKTEMMSIPSGSSGTTADNCDCAPTVTIMHGYRDNNAVQQSGVTGVAHCQTACINRHACVGYDIRNGNCYLSLPTLGTSVPYTDYYSVDTSSYRYELTRSSCGNSCKDKWLLYMNTRMEESTATHNTAATTPRACRHACLHDSSCTAIDFNMVDKKCYTGTSSSVMMPVGTVAGWNHLSLYRQAYCD